MINNVLNKIKPVLFIRTFCDENNTLVFNLSFLTSVIIKYYIFIFLYIQIARGAIWIIP